MVLSDDKDNESSLQPTPRPSAFGAAAGAPAASASRHFALQRTQLILKRLQKLTPSFFEGVSFSKSLND